MIVSFVHKFIFVKTRKVAGTSVELALAPNCGPEDIITPTVPTEAGHERACIELPRNYSALPGFERAFRWSAKAGFETPFHNLTKRRLMIYKQHMSAARIRRRLEKTKPGFWNEAFSFTIERHPYDKCLSQAAFMLSRIMPKPIPEVAAVRRIDEAIQTGEIERWSDWKNYTYNGEICVNRIIRYENIADEFKDVSRIIQLPEIHLPQAKAGARETTKRPSHEVLSERQKTAIQAAFANEFSYFQFET
ncbi:hypothetical protein [Ferruginivarius sediminum]|uniref:hypothetical protein n=1 Tax=Ferruginivarius sediminum TaxID=2661937 RepID=UPI0011C02828|nr:hypothetical protein [Ferruginivarius sediminum]